MVHRRLAITIAAILIMMFVMPADAAKKKKPKYRAPDMGTSLSLDGRNTGRSRTCWSETFIYDEYGAPVGPYCH